MTKRWKMRQWEGNSVVKRAGLSEQTDLNSLKGEMKEIGSQEAALVCSVFVEESDSPESNLPCDICNQLLGLIPVVRKTVAFVAKHIFSLVTNQWGETYVGGALVLGCPCGRSADDAGQTIQHPRSSPLLGGLHWRWWLEAAGLGPALPAVPGLWECVVSW